MGIPVKKVGIWLMVLACVLFCVSCASAPAEQPADAEDTAKAFLTAF